MIGIGLSWQAGLGFRAAAGKRHLPGRPGKAICSSLTVKNLRLSSRRLMGGQIDVQEIAHSQWQVNDVLVEILSWNQVELNLAVFRQAILQR